MGPTPMIGRMGRFGFLGCTPSKRRSRIRLGGFIA
jgi:hypothetical protein